MPGAGGGGGHGLGFGPNLTPMVDVVMVILIFFMAAAAFLGPEWFLRASLPEANTASGEPANGDQSIVLPSMRLRIVLRVDDGETVAEFEGSGAQPLEQFLEAFAGAAPGLVAGDNGGSITISPEGDVPWEDVISVHEAASAAGLGTVRLD